MSVTAFRPSSALIKIIALLTIMAVTMRFFYSHNETVIPFITAALVVSLVVTLIDLFQSKNPPSFIVTRSMPTQLSFNRWHTVNYDIENASTAIIHLYIKEHVNQHFKLDWPSKKISILPGKHALLKFRIKSLKRGPAQIGPIELCLSSSWHLWQFFWINDDIIQVKTYPDFERLKQYQSLKGMSNVPTNGLKQMKKRGSGIEFHQLREFRQGDSIRQIDWQATSKRQKLIAKEYQEERNQHITVMLDASNRMNIETKVGTHFDAALNALLMLSHTVLKQGDWFSMQSFNQKERWLPAIKGVQNVSKIMNHFYDLEADESASDFMTAVNSLLSKRSKRSLVLLVTTLNDQNFEALVPALKRLQQHHLVALINIENVALNEVLNEDINDVSDANRYCAAIELKNNAIGNLKRIEKEGIICIDCKPEYLLPYVINTYLNVKHSGLL
ncbi:MAG: DUF58 domain-containing protein [Colwellia sp.]